jgi:transcriptional regulator with XRE-family HTH domain
MLQEEFGDMMGVTNQQVSNWENGRGQPPKSKLERLAHRLGIPVRVFAEDGPRPRDVPIRVPGYRLEQALDAANTRLALLRDQFRSYHDNGLTPDDTALVHWLKMAQEALELTQRLEAEGEADSEP